MGYKVGKMGYNASNKRYGLLIADLWHIDGFHCGNTLEFYDYDQEEWIPARIEMSWPDQEYYLYGTELKGEDLEGLKIRVKTGDEDDEDDIY